MKLHEILGPAVLAAISITTTIISAAPTEQYNYQPSKVPDPLQKAIDNPHYKPPQDDVAVVEETPGPISQVLLSPVQLTSQEESYFEKILKKRSPTYCKKCGGGYGGGYGDGGYGGGYDGGGSSIVVVPVPVGGGGGHNGGGGCYGGGCGGGGGCHGGGGCGGGGSYGGSYAQASASASSGSYSGSYRK